MSGYTAGMLSGDRTQAAANARVIAVRHGLLETTKSRFYLNYDEYGRPDAPLTVAYWFWVIQGAGRTIVVDTGFSADGGAKRNRSSLVSVPTALAGLGIGPRSDVDLVLTHGHYDHIGNLDYFPVQPVHIGRAELDFWLGPDSKHLQFQSVVEERELAELAAVAQSGRIRPVDAAVTIAPGVDLVPLPGHTPGQLGVLVQTAAGRVLLASDATHFREELDADMPFKHNTDLVGLYRGLETMRTWLADGTVDILIPGHEAAVFDEFPRVDGALRDHAIVIG
jgi:glyoxylase-like metal-dependent hydrolase (beta-lactamase superfamily II)